MNVLDIKDLEVHYRQPGSTRRRFHAVDGVSFTIAAGETVGLVGESGSGKSTIGRAVLGLAPRSVGSVEIAGEGTGRAATAAKAQAIFQDPYSSLNPLRTIGDTLAEPLKVQRVGRAERRARIESLLERVGLPRAAVDRYPHEFSGGQRQRIAIARALLIDPMLVVCDEAISALDLSTQAAVINLLNELQQEKGVAYLFIAHDLVAVHHISDRVLVLYRGRVMESGPADLVCTEPLHPYSRALWASAPVPDPAAQRARRTQAEEIVAASSVAGPAVPGDGCPFAVRCPLASAVCSTTRPRDMPYDGRQIACHLFDPASGHPRAGEGRAAVLEAHPLSAP